MKLLLIRHGESRGNLNRRWQGWLDEPLTERGLAQAHRLAERLQKWTIEHPEPIVAVYSSTLARAYQTATVLSRQLDVPLVLDGRLRERDVGALQGLTWPEIEARYPEVAQTIRERWNIPEPPHGETLIHFTARVWGAIGEIIDRNGQDAARNVAIVSHGGTLNAYLNQLAGRGADMPFLFSFGNTSFSVVQFTNGRPRIVLVNDLCHLDQN